MTGIRFLGKSDGYYLTIDDSPSENTLWILDLLDEYNLKATFFCIGKNIAQYPLQYRQIVERGHSVGYHSYHHISAWQMSREEFEDDFELCSDIFPSQIYRPPYGRLSIASYYFLKQKGIKTILWNKLLYDWKPLENPIQTMNDKLKNAPLGSIFVFHDNEKSFENVKKMLPLFLKSTVNKGIRILSIN